MKILLLGGTRYFGRLILRELLKNGNEVVVVSRKAPLEENIIAISGERDDKSTLSSINKYAPYDIVIDNIAYQPYQIKNLQQAILYDQKILLYILTSTSAVYLDKYLSGLLSEEDMANEEHICSDFSMANIKSYALGKIACENFLKASGLPYLILRLPFVTGPDDFSCRLAYYIHRILYGVVLIPDDANLLQQIYSIDISNVWLESISKFDKMAHKTINVTPEAIGIEEYLKTISNIMGKRVEMVRIDHKKWKGLAPDFPYIYNQVMKNNLFHYLFQTHLTLVKNFLSETVKWYLQNPALWEKKFVPSAQEFNMLKFYSRKDG